MDANPRKYRDVPTVFTSHSTKCSIVAVRLSRVFVTCTPGRWRAPRRAVHSIGLYPMYFRLVRGRYTRTSNMILSSNAHLVLFDILTDDVDLIPCSDITLGVVEDTRVGIPRRTLFSTKYLNVRLIINMSHWVPRIWIEAWVGPFDGIQRLDNRYVPSIPQFQGGGECYSRHALAWVIGRTSSPVTQ